MNNNHLSLPSYDILRTHVIESLKRYWPVQSEPLELLPITQRNFFEIDKILRMQEISLPGWAEECGVDGHLLVPQETCREDCHWERVDWWLAIFLLLESWHERMWELNHGPIHSYSYRLKGWDDRVWERAWVNRIALFLRKWVGHANKNDTSKFVGNLPESQFLMTHDMDAVEKTLSISLKQGLFNLFNMSKSLVRCRTPLVTKYAVQALKFFFRKDDWWKIDELMLLEHSADIRGVFHFYADLGPKNLKQWFFDPSYKIRDDRLRGLLLKLHEAGHEVGLHPGFDTWKNCNSIATQRKNLEEVSGLKVTHCRQHWLRFSWHDTWVNQECAGLKKDTTLMFNDRPGFRNASAIAWKPWNPKSSKIHEITALPTVMMDSHFYDYQSCTADERRQKMDAWLRECHAVCGEIAVLWHPHSLSNDYGWSAGFDNLLETLRDIF